MLNIVSAIPALLAVFTMHYLYESLFTYPKEGQGRFLTPIPRTILLLLTLVPGIIYSYQYQLDLWGMIFHNLFFAAMLYLLLICYFEAAVNTILMVGARKNYTPTEDGPTRQKVEAEFGEYLSSAVVGSAISIVMLVLLFKESATLFLFSLVFGGVAIAVDRLLVRKDEDELERVIQMLKGKNGSE